LAAQFAAFARGNLQLFNFSAFIRAPEHGGNSCVRKAVKWVAQPLAEHARKIEPRWDSACYVGGARSKTSSHSKSSGRVSFGFGSLETTSLMGWPMSSQAAVSSVTSRPFRRTSSMAPTDNAHAEGLGSLDGPESGAIKCALDESAVGRFLNGVGDRLGGNGGAMVAGGLDSTSNEALAGAWRAASWITTISEAGDNASRPFQTESWRSAPPVTRRKGFLKLHLGVSSAKADCIPSRMTTMISSTHSAWSNRCRCERR